MNLANKQAIGRVVKISTCSISVLQWCRDETARLN